METAKDQRLMLFLAALVFFAYCPFFVADLFWDDNVVLRFDMPVNDPETWSRLLTGRCVLFPEGAYPYYRPVVDALLLSEFALTGTHPFLYHLTNFVLHLGSALLTLALLRRVFGIPDGAALLGAGLFALLSLQVESVMWPAARPAVLSVFFGLIAFRFGVAVGTATDMRSQIGLGFGCLAALAFALGSKEVTLVYPIAALMVALHPAAKPTRGQWVLLGAVFVVVAAYLLHIRSAISRDDNTPKYGALVWYARMVSAFGFYVPKLGPFGQYPNYMLDIETTWIGYPVLGVCAAVAVLWGLTAALRRRGEFPLVLFGGLLVLAGGTAITLVAGQRFLADRYLYQSLWGLGVAAAALAGTRVGVRGVAIALGLLSITTLLHSLDWRSTPTIWARTLAAEPGNVAANYEVATWHQAKGSIDPAIQHFTAAAFDGQWYEHKVSVSAANTLAPLLRDAGRHGEADAALRVGTYYLYSKPSALVLLAIHAFQRGDTERATMLGQSVVDDGTLDFSVCLDLALLNARLGAREQEAVRWYKLALERGGPGVPELDLLMLSTP